MWVAYNLDPHLFWNLTAEEVTAVLKRKIEQDRQAYLRAGLIAATIINVNLKKGRALVQPEDFFKKEESVGKVRMPPKEALNFMDAFAEQQNKVARRSPHKVGRRPA